MTGRDWVDGKPWGSDTGTEKCTKCGAIIRYSVPEGPPTAYEKYDLDCECGEIMRIDAFGPPTVLSVLKKGK